MTNKLLNDKTLTNAQRAYVLSLTERPRFRVGGAAMSATVVVATGILLFAAAEPDRCPLPLKRIGELFALLIVLLECLCPVLGFMVGVTLAAQCDLDMEKARAIAEPSIKSESETTGTRLRTWVTRFVFAAFVLSLAMNGWVVAAAFCCCLWVTTKLVSHGIRASIVKYIKLAVPAVDGADRVKAVATTAGKSTP